MNRINLLSVVFASLFICSAYSVSAHNYFEYIEVNTIVSDTSKLEGKIYNVAEEAPRFPGCKDIADKIERDECARKKMLTFIYGNVKYPAEAKENGIQGATAIRFVVASDGTLHNFEVPRPLGGGCDEEAIRVIKSMPNWEPAMFNGEPVNARFAVPIKFKLEGMPSKEYKKDRRNRKNKG